MGVYATYAREDASKVFAKNVQGNKLFCFVNRTLMLLMPKKKIKP
jgi:hypothetical protein